MDDEFDLRADWAQEVSNGDTRLGYDDWLYHQSEAERSSHLEFEDWPERQSPVLLIVILCGIVAAGALGVFAMMWAASLLQGVGR